MDNVANRLTPPIPLPRRRHGPSLRLPILVGVISLASGLVLLVLLHLFPTLRVEVSPADGKLAQAFTAKTQIEQKINEETDKKAANTNEQNKLDATLEILNADIKTKTQEHDTLNHRGETQRALDAVRAIDNDNKSISENTVRKQRIQENGDAIDRGIEEAKQQLSKIVVSIDELQPRSTLSVFGIILLSVGIGTLAATARALFHAISGLQALAGGPAALSLLYLWNVFGDGHDMFSIITVSAIGGLGVSEVIKLVDRHVGGHNNAGAQDDKSDK